MTLNLASRTFLNSCKKCDIFIKSNKLRLVSLNQLRTIFYRSSYNNNIHGYHYPDFIGSNVYEENSKNILSRNHLSHIVGK